MKYPFLDDGLPILKTQFGLLPREMDRWSQEDKEALVTATISHVQDGEHDSRVRLGEIILEIRQKYPFEARY